MRKKLRIVAAVIAVIALLALTVQVLAAWVGSIRADVRVDEPIIVAQSLTPIPVSIFPGELFGFEGEISNTSSVPYGIRLGGFLWWMWEATGEEVKLSLEDLADSGEITLLAGPGPQEFGIVEIYINGSPYSPGTLINIGPGETHDVKVVVTTSHSIPAGRLTAEVFVLREAPLG